MFPASDLFGGNVHWEWFTSISALLIDWSSHETYDLEQFAAKSSRLRKLELFTKDLSQIGLLCGLISLEHLNILHSNHMESVEDRRNSLEQFRRFVNLRGKQLKTLKLTTNLQLPEFYSLINENFTNLKLVELNLDSKLYVDDSFYITIAKVRSLRKLSLNFSFGLNGHQLDLVLHCHKLRYLRFNVSTVESSLTIDLIEEKLTNYSNKHPNRRLNCYAKFGNGEEGLERDFGNFKIYFMG